MAWATSSAKLPVMGINIAGPLHPVRPHRRVPPFPQVVIDLADTAGARFAPLSLVGLEGAGGWFLGGGFLSGFRFGSPDSLVDLVRRVLPHGIGDVGVGVQGGGGGDMADDGERVLTSIPFSKDMVAKVCRRS